FPNNNQYYPAITALDGGGFVVTWYSFDAQQPEDQSGTAIKARIFDAAGNLVGDSLTGDEGANTIIGLGADDTLIGLGGDDSLLGGLGDDILNGGLGADILTGGDGGDTFLYTDIGEADDIITDFDVSLDGNSDDDQIDIGALLDAAFGGSGDEVSAASVENYVRVTESGSDAVISINADGAGTDWQDVATLSGVSMGETIKVVVDEDGSYADVAVA
ncbi:MAG: calcium-binding protein, partial [Rhodobacteraceae bacterium]|nr:calcium-binding protein [Paracoccaceae bacterium]